MHMHIHAHAQSCLAPYKLKHNNGGKLSEKTGSVVRKVSVEESSAQVVTQHASLQRGRIQAHTKVHSTMMLTHAGLVARPVTTSVCSTLLEEHCTAYTLLHRGN